MVVFVAILTKSCLFSPEFNWVPVWRVWEHRLLLPVFIGLREPREFSLDRLPTIPVDVTPPFDKSLDVFRCRARWMTAVSNCINVFTPLVVCSSIVEKCVIVGDAAPVMKDVCDEKLKRIRKPLKLLAVLTEWVGLFVKRGRILFLNFFRIYCLLPGICLVQVVTHARPPPDEHQPGTSRGCVRFRTQSPQVVTDCKDVGAGGFV